MRHALWVWGLATVVGVGSNAEGQDEGPGSQARAPGEAGEGAPFRLDDYQEALEDYQFEIDDFQRKLAQLDDEVDVLREAAVRGEVAGSRTLLVHRNALGAGFDIEKATYRVDGNVIFNEGADSDRLDRTTLELFDGALGPGEHLLEVELTVRGGGLSLFGSTGAYRYKLKSRFPFTATEGRTTKVEVTAFLRSDLTARIEQRLSIKYELGSGPGPSLR